MLELRAHRGPFVLREPLFPRHGLDSRDKYGIVDQTEAVVVLLVYEVVTIFSTELDNEIDDTQIGYGHLDRIGLDVNDGYTLSLQGMFELDHEQRSALGHDVIDVTNIP